MIKESVVHLDPWEIPWTIGSSHKGVISDCEETKERMEVFVHPSKKRRSCLPPGTAFGANTASVTSGAVGATLTIRPGSVPGSPATGSPGSTKFASNS